MSFELAFTLVSAFSIFFIGVVVYFHDRKSVTNTLFFFIALATLFWSVANYFSIVASPTEVLRWIRLVLFFAAPHAVLFFLFVYNFPSRKIIMKKWLFWLIITTMVIAMVATQTAYIFSGIDIRDGQVVPVPGVLISLFVVVALGSLLSGVFLAVKKYHLAKESEKRRWLFLLAGVIISYLLLILTNFGFVVFLDNTSFIIFGPLFMLPTIISMAYAILKHHMLNVRAVTTEILTFVILFITLLEVFISENLTEVIIRIAIFLLLFAFSIFLIRSVLKEIKQREQLEKLSNELYKANQKLKDLDQLKTEFLSIASHQLRTPLSGIKGYLSMMIDGDFGKFSKEQGGILNRVKAEVDRLVRLVQDFLNVSRIESGRLQIAMLEFDIAAVINTVVKELAPAAESKGLSLSCDSADKKVMVTGDPDKLKDVIVNLTDNAIKYTEKGRVWISLSANDKEVTIEIHDSGVGIDREEIKKLFSKFKRAKGIARVSASGSGLGLFIAKKIIIGHGGDIWATSNGEGKGSVFAFTIPVKGKLLPKK